MQIKDKPFGLNKILQKNTTVRAWIDVILIESLRVAALNIIIKIFKCHGVRPWVSTLGSGQIQHFEVVLFPDFYIKSSCIYCILCNLIYAAGLIKVQQYHFGFMTSCLYN